MTKTTLHNHERFNNYDVLRCISCFTVVVLHIAAIYVNDDFKNIISETDYFWGGLYRVMSIFAVPNFVMLSGAFLIQYKNADYKFFYAKMFKKIIIPTFIFSIIYVLVQYAEIIIADRLKIFKVSSGEIDWVEPLKKLLSGKPNVAMWYMFMIIGLYTVTPIIVRIKESLTTKTYSFVGIALT